MVGPGAVRTSTARRKSRPPFRERHLTILLPLNSTPKGLEPPAACTRPRRPSCSTSTPLRSMRSKVALDLAGAHPAGVERDHLVVEAGQAALVFANQNRFGA